MPAVVDLAAMRDAIAQMGGDAAQINPLVPAELVIDHSVQVDAFGTRDAFRVNAEREFERNQERYSFLRWGQGAFDDFSVVPPGHRDRPPGQPRVPRARGLSATRRPGQAYPDTLVGTDSHTTMVNGLGVLGWGVGGNRGRGGDARPADVDADPAGARLPPARRAARGRDRDRPRADRHRDAARARRRGDVRGVLRRRPRRPAACRPRDDRQHVAGVRLDLRDLPDRRRDAHNTSSSPAARPSRSRSSRHMPRSRGCGTTRARSSRPSPTRSSSTSATVEPSLAGPKRPQDRVVAQSSRRPSSRRRCATTSQRRRSGRRAGRGGRRVLSGV